MRLGRIQNDYSAAGFDLVKAEKLQFVEICCNNQEDGERLIASKADVKEQIRRTGIDVSCVGRWNHNILENGEIVEERKEHYLALLDTAIELGAKTFVCGCNYDESISLWKNYGLAISFFGELLDRAAGRINVAVENCGWHNFIVSPRQWEVILGELPELKIKYDASHAYKRNDDYMAELAGWGDRIAHVHIKGKVMVEGQKIPDPPAGMDDLKWGSIFAALYAHNYDGDLSLEPHSKVWKGERGEAGIEFARRYISSFMM